MSVCSEVQGPHVRHGPLTCFQERKLGWSFGVSWVYVGGKVGGRAPGPEKSPGSIIQGRERKEPLKTAGSPSPGDGHFLGDVVSSS